MLTMLTPSRPSLANTTTMTPRMSTPIATQRLVELRDGRTRGGIEKRLVQIGEIQPVLFQVGEALWFVPDDFHMIFCIYNLFRRQAICRYKMRFAE
jgi:hypothetical protein